MKAARLVVLGVAVAAGGIAAYLAAGSKAPPPPPPTPVVQIPMVDVLVAKTDLSRGQVIDTQDIGWQTWPADAANSNFVKKSDRPDALSLSKQMGTISLTLRSLLDASSGPAAGGDNTKEGPINTVRFGVSTLGTGH